MSTIFFVISQELAEIFLKSGLKEITESRYPEDYHEIITKGYNPDIHRRAFAKSSTFLILFDYKKLVFHDQWSPVLGYRKEKIAIQELTSLLVFSRLQNETRARIRRNYEPFRIETLMKDIKLGVSRLKPLAIQEVIRAYSFIKTNLNIVTEEEKVSEKVRQILHS